MIWIITLPANSKCSLGSAHLASGRTQTPQLLGKYIMTSQSHDILLSSRSLEIDRQKGIALQACDLSAMRKQPSKKFTWEVATVSGEHLLRRWRRSVPHLDAGAALIHWRLASHSPTGSD